MDNKIPEIMELFEKVVDIIDHGSHVPFSKKVSVPEDELYDVLDQLKSAIPEEVERAGKILAQSDELIVEAESKAAAIVAEAEGKAAAIVEEAKSKKETLLNESTLVHEEEAIAQELKANAEAVATQIKVDAEAYAGQTRADALKYASDVLSYLEGTLNNALTSISGDRSNVQMELSKLRVVKLSHLLKVAGNNFVNLRPSLCDGLFVCFNADILAKW